MSAITRNVLSTFSAPKKIVQFDGTPSGRKPGAVHHAE
jgi:hypothetical protein